MKKKKGFTLVELIVTIALLALIGSVIAINMVGLNKKQEDKEQTRIESLIKAAAESYVTVEHIQTDCLNVQKLIEKSYLKENAVKDYESYFVKVNKKDGIYEVVEKVADESKCEGTIKEKYTLTYDANGGNNAPSKVTSEALSKVSISTQIPNRSGYEFAGWENKKDKSVYQPNDKITLTNNTTLYARWNTGFYSLTYNKNTIDNVSNMPENVENIGYNSLIHISSSIPTRTGYSFLGWSTSQDGDVQYNANSEHTIVSNLYLYAKWTEGIYAITLDQQGGSGGTNTIYEKYSQGIYSNNTATQAITKVNIPTRTGYVFKGYYENKNGSGKQLIDASGNITSNFNNKYITSNKTIYASWETMPLVKITVENGIVTGANNATRNGSGTNPYEYYVLKGSNSNYSFKANDGYVFDSLQCSNSSKIVKQTSNTNTTAYLELGNVDNSMECTIKFKSVQLTLKVPSYFAYNWADLQKLDSSLDKTDVTLNTDKGIFEIKMDVNPFKLNSESTITVYGDKIENFDKNTFTSMFAVNTEGKGQGKTGQNSNFTCDIYSDVNSADYTKIKLKYNSSTYPNELTCDLSSFYIGYPIQISDINRLFDRGNDLDDIPITNPDVYIINANKIDGIDIVYTQSFKSDFKGENVGEFFKFYKILDKSFPKSNKYFNCNVKDNSIYLQINEIPTELKNSSESFVIKDIYNSKNAYMTINTHANSLYINDNYEGISGNIGSIVDDIMLGIDGYFSKPTYDYSFVAYHGTIENVKVKKNGVETNKYSVMNSYNGQIFSVSSDDPSTLDVSFAVRLKSDSVPGFLGVSYLYNSYDPCGLASFQTTKMGGYGTFHATNFRPNDNDDACYLLFVDDGVATGSESGGSRNCLYDSDGDWIQESC